MLAATRLLLTTGTPYSLRWLALRAVITSGGEDDAAAVLGRMLVAPDAALCHAVMALGTRATGEKLLNTFVVDGALRDGAPVEVLHALGYLGVLESEPVLWRAATTPDYHAQQQACLGLVDLPCTGRAHAIADAIRDCHGRNLFAEFLPALACKTDEGLALIEPLIADDAPTSTDCFGGVLLGLALLGARATFERVLFDPHWEAVDGPTGNRRWCGLAVNILGLSICRLHRERRGALGSGDIDTLAALVRLHVAPYARSFVHAERAPADDDIAVYTEFFLTDEALDDAARRRDRSHARRDLDEARAALDERITTLLCAPVP